MILEVDLCSNQARREAGEFLLEFQAAHAFAFGSWLVFKETFELVGRPHPCTYKLFSSMLASILNLLPAHWLLCWGASFVPPQYLDLLATIYFSPGLRCLGYLHQ